MKKLIVTMAIMFCFLIGERTSGFNKICYYDCIDGQRAITISAIAL